MTSSTRRWTRVGAAALIAGLAMAPATRAEPEGEWERDAGPEVLYVLPEDAQGSPTHVLLRIVDDVTREPLPGATGALISQSEYPITGLTAPDRTGVADDDGWLRIRADDLGWEPSSSWPSAYWVYVEAPGHGGLATSPGRIEGEVRLARASGQLVEVRDGLDRAVSGAMIGVRSSRTCGHMPDQRVAMTGLDGRAVIPDLAAYSSDEDLFAWETWVVGDGLQSQYDDLHLRTRPRAAQVLRHRPSYPVEGVIIDADDKPVAGVHVGGNGGHRGPWALTDALGRFRLVGVVPFGGLTVVTPEGEKSRTASTVLPNFVAPPPGVKRIFRLPAKGPNSKDGVPTEVQIQVRDAATKEALAEPGEAPLTAVRESDGATVRDESGHIGALPRGTWTVSAGGGVAPFALAQARLEVGDAPPSPVVLNLTRQPPLRVAWTGPKPEGTSVWLVSPTEERVVQDAEIGAGVVPVPATGALAFRIESSPLDPVFVPIPEPRPAPAATPLALHVQPTLVVVARLAGPDSKPVPGWLLADADAVLDRAMFVEWAPDSEATAVPEVRVPAAGEVDLLAIPAGRALLPRRLRVPISAADAERGRLDLGTLALESRGDRSLTAVKPDGMPLPGPLGFRVLQNGGARDVIPSEDQPSRCDPLLLPLQAGDVVEVQPPPEIARQFAHPVRTRLEGPGPWKVTIDPPATSIVLEAADEGGRPLAATLVIDGKDFTGEAVTDDAGVRHPFEVAGLEPGPHRVAVAAVNRLTHLYRVVLRAGEHRTLSPHLRLAPPPSPPK